MDGLLPVVAVLGGAVVGSFLTTLLSHISTSKRELRHDRLDVLIALMRGRNDIFAEGVALEVNTIPILFHDQPKVRLAYEKFCAVPNGPPANLHRRYDDLVLAVAKALNFSDWSVADIDLGYYPPPVPDKAAMRTAATTNRLPSVRSDRPAHVDQNIGAPPSDSRP